MFRIKGQVQTSHLSNLQTYRPKSHFRDNGQSNTFILPNTKPNMFTYHVSHQGTSSNFPFIKLVGIQTKISFSRRGSIQYFHFTEYKTKQVHISCFASRDNFKLPIYQSCRQIDLNLIFATKSFQYFYFTEYKSKYFRDKVIPILPFYQIQNQIGSHIMFHIKGHIQTSNLSNM